MTSRRIGSTKSKQGIIGHITCPKCELTITIKASAQVYKKVKNR